MVCRGKLLSCSSVILRAAAVAVGLYNNLPTLKSFKIFNSKEGIVHKTSQPLGSLAFFMLFLIKIDRNSLTDTKTSSLTKIVRL